MKSSPLPRWQVECLPPGDCKTKTIIVSAPDQLSAINLALGGLDISKCLIAVDLADYSEISKLPEIRP